MQQIDQELIKLLGQRITCLTESTLLGLEEDTSKLTQLLAQMGVPEYVWRSVVTSCAAAITTATSPPAQVKPRRVTVVGGHGKMGFFFTQQLSAAGHTVKVLEQKDWNHADKLLGDAELVLICVPTEHALTVIQTAAQYLTSSTALADTTSIKAPIVQAMLNHHQGPVLGLHPMFSPNSGDQSFLSQNVVVCPGRQLEAFQWFLDLIEGKGSNLIPCAPDEHDQMMVIVQAIRHFSTLSLGVFLAESGINIGRSLEFASPLYRLEIDIISRLFTQDVSLYLGTMLATADPCQAIVRLAATSSRLAQLVAQNDQTGLRHEFEATRDVFQPEVVRALEESDSVIGGLSVFLAANKAKAQACSVNSDSVPIDQAQPDIKRWQRQTEVAQPTEPI